MDVLNSFYGLIPVTIAQSLIVSFVVLGVMLPFRILNFPDLTSEGAFPLGGCVCGTLITAGVNPFLACFIALLCGFAAGCTTAFIHLRFRINTLLAGILVMTMLYSINLRIMGRTNIPLFTYDTVFTVLAGPSANFPWTKILIVGLLVALVLGAMLYFFMSEKGTAMRAVGASPDMAEAQGVNVGTATIIGVGVASALSATGGSIMVQTQGFADVNMGFGILINGLAALIIGEAITGRQTILRQVVAPVIGSLVYYQLISFCLTLGLAPADLKFATGAFVLLMLALPNLRRSSAGVQIREKTRE
ncbi:putative ABC transport system permease protein [Phyllobacterium trifolii]|uniref:Putative ABC transport system permease protein n=1 Tax=Phyllobacterium trifolii TaxID=300193 RepID=A0A839UA69_9HYPH|nr:ABC transporter permease [Phyllobacterium trifolii]MBB3146763.1 putative ABC transport system permease protein [Phyllobacterium trifolii]